MERLSPIKSYTKLPALPGVYLFKNKQGTVLYVGKAKNLKSRVASYFHSQTDIKANAIISLSTAIDHILTKNEVEAMLLEAKLIRNYQPKFNILLKTGQPYLYLLFSKETLPELQIVRTRKKKGLYFGPFLEKRPARQVYNFLIKTFRLKLCKKKIPNGCLYYHLGTCAGSCRDDFDKESYAIRLELAKQALKKGHKKFLRYLEKQIDKSNQKLNFEKSKELHSYHQAFEKVFTTIDTNFLGKEKALSHKHIWIHIPDNKTLFLFDEINGITKTKDIFYLQLVDTSIKVLGTFFERYYNTHDCQNMIVTNFSLESRKTIEQFLRQWHKKSFPVTIVTQPPAGHLANLIVLAATHAQQELTKQKNLGEELKLFLNLTKEPVTIDCFDVSHNQGTAMVGSCIRFKNGKPDKNNFRRFKIKTVSQQNDYACLQEIVSRRYRDREELPDLILIDGGKGQLNAVQSLFPQANFASLAKREEILFSNHFPEGKKLDQKSFVGQSLMALRDYAHHFAISYHSRILEKYWQA